MQMCCYAIVIPQAASIPSAPCNTYADLEAEEHLWANGYLTRRVHFCHIHSRAHALSSFLLACALVHTRATHRTKGELVTFGKPLVFSKSPAARRPSLRPFSSCLPREQTPCYGDVVAPTLCRSSHHTALVDSALALAGQRGVAFGSSWRHNATRCESLAHPHPCLARPQSDSPRSWGQTTAPCWQCLASPERR